ncbi:hypothetical protein IWX49DRAFT_557499 [Phyllosticta citricarpa]
MRAFTFALLALSLRQLHWQVKPLTPGQLAMQVSGCNRTTITTTFYTTATVSDCSFPGYESSLSQISSADHGESIISKSSTYSEWREIYRASRRESGVAKDESLPSTKDFPAVLAPKDFAIVFEEETFCFTLTRCNRWERDCRPDRTIISTQIVTRTKTFTSTSTYPKPPSQVNNQPRPTYAPPTTSSSSSIATIIHTESVTILVSKCSSAISASASRSSSHSTTKITMQTGTFWSTICSSISTATNSPGSITEISVSTTTKTIDQNMTATIMSPSTTTKTLYSNTTKSLAASTTTASIFLSNLIKSIDSQTSLSPDTSTTSPDENITTRTMSLSITTETLYLNKTQTMTSIPTLTSTTRVLRTFTTTNLTTATAVLPSPAASTPAPSTTVTSNSQIPPSSPSPFCTGQCTVAAATINLIVWPDQTAETRQVISGTPITSVKAGITFLQSMSAYEICGSGTRTVGPETALPTFFPFDPKDISTITWTSWSSTFTKTEDGTTYEWWTASWSTITKSFDFTQLASCRQGTYGYSFPAISVTSAASGSYFTGASTGISSVFWPPCSPIFAIPTKITNFVPAWSTCTPNAPNGWFDPTISWTPLDGEITGPYGSATEMSASGTAVPELNTETTTTMSTSSRSHRTTPQASASLSESTPSIASVTSSSPTVSGSRPSETLNSDTSTSETASTMRKPTPTCGTSSSNSSNSQHVSVSRTSAGPSSQSPTSSTSTIKTSKYSSIPFPCSPASPTSDISITSLPSILTRSTSSSSSTHSSNSSFSYSTSASTFLYTTPATSLSGSTSSTPFPSTKSSNEVVPSSHSPQFPTSPVDPLYTLSIFRTSASPAQGSAPNSSDITATPFISSTLPSSTAPFQSTFFANSSTSSTPSCLTQPSSSGPLSQSSSPSILSMPLSPSISYSSASFPQTSSSSLASTSTSLTAAPSSAAPSRNTSSSGARRLFPFPFLHSQIFNSTLFWELTAAGFWHLILG